MTTRENLGTVQTYELAIHGPDYMGKHWRGNPRQHLGIKDSQQLPEPPYELIENQEGALVFVDIKGREV